MFRQVSESSGTATSSAAGQLPLCHIGKENKGDRDNKGGSDMAWEKAEPRNMFDPEKDVVFHRFGSICSPIFVF